MLAANFTKPLQGALFIKYRDLIMNSSSDHSRTSCEITGACYVSSGHGWTL